jgi:iron complex transport system substrate-binding protein
VNAGGGLARLGALRGSGRSVRLVAATATGLVLAALLAAGCGIGDGADTTGGVAASPGELQSSSDDRRVVALDQPAALNALSLGVEPSLVFAGFGSQPELEEILASHDIPLQPFTISEPSLEAVAAARPDLIIGSGHPVTTAAYDDYSAIAPTVVIPFVADWRAQLDAVAAGLDRQDEADRLAAYIDERMDALRRALVDRGVDGKTVSVIGSIPGEPFAFPGSGLAGRLLTQLGLARPPAEDVEVPAQQGIVAFSLERLTDHDADTLITVTGAVYDTEAVITTSPLYAALGAVGRGRAFQVSGDIWLGAFPFAAAWMLGDLEDILLDDRPAGGTALERWSMLVGDL